ncbi:YkgJ family cysteine cluster protein [Paraglaciecola sp.]|uniref:YkgJ family cysteine cluster protein n=1 Tax=Paraglaciecola sp. TaxID=1920173 RepID=UPI003EF12C05
MKECTQCGKCCVKYADGDLSASDNDLDMWKLFRPDIAEYTKGGLIWFSPQNGKRLSFCPFLRENIHPDQADKKLYTCDIYHDRPEDCRFYPVTIQQMLNDECEMLESNEVLEPVKAQATLDRLMKDSRPSYD